MLDCFFALCVIVRFASPCVSSLCVGGRSGRHPFVVAVARVALVLRAQIKASCVLTRLRAPGKKPPPSETTHIKAAAITFARSVAVRCVSRGALLYRRLAFFRFITAVKPNSGLNVHSLSQKTKVKMFNTARQNCSYIHNKSAAGHHAKNYSTILIARSGTNL